MPRKTPVRPNTDRGRERTIAEIEQEISAALESAHAVLSAGILGKLLAALIEQHKRETSRL